MTTPWRCEFCGGPGRVSHAVGLGETTRTVYRCDGCGSCQIDEPFSAAELRRFYEVEYHTGLAWQHAKCRRLAADYLPKVLRHVRPDRAARPLARALEIGAGYGYFAACFQEAVRIPIDVVEWNQDCRRHIRRAFPELDLAVPDLADLPPGRRYDYVFCFHTAEHMQRLGDFLDAAAGLLVPGGKLLLLTPNAEARGFRELVWRWGWACPDQHFQFLSPRIPEAYYRGHGFRPLAVRDFVPATVHFPSAAHPHVRDAVTWVVQRIGRRSKLRTAHWRVARRLLLRLEASLWPQMAAVELLPLERLWAGLTQRRPYDELMVLLERAAEAPRPLPRAAAQQGDRAGAQDVGQQQPGLAVVGGRL